MSTAAQISANQINAQSSTGPRTEAGKTKQAIAGMEKTFKEFNPGFPFRYYFTDEELANAKNLLEAENLFRREKLSDYTHELGFWWSSTGIEYFRGYYKNLRAVSRNEINRYVRTYVQGKPHIGVALLSAEAQTAAKITQEDLIGK